MATTTYNFTTNSAWTFGGSAFNSIGKHKSTNSRHATDRNNYGYIIPDYLTATSYVFEDAFWEWSGTPQSLGVPTSTTITNMRVIYAVRFRCCNDRNRHIHESAAFDPGTFYCGPFSIHNASTGAQLYIMNTVLVAPGRTGTGDWSYWPPQNPGVSKDNASGINFRPKNWAIIDDNVTTSLNSSTTYKFRINVSFPDQSVPDVASIKITGITFQFTY